MRSDASPSPDVQPRSYRSVLSGFADLVRRHARGTLEVVTADGHHHRVFFEHGRPVGVEVSGDVAPLVEILGQWEQLRGDMDLLRLIVASSATASERREALVASGVVSPARLAEAERRQVLEELAFLFGLAGVTTTHHEDIARPSEMTTKVLPVHALLHFVRRTEARDVAAGYVARMGDIPLALSPEVDLPGLGLDEAESAVAWKLAVEPRSLDQLLSSELDPDAVRRVLFALGLAGAISRRPRARSSSPARGTPSSSGSAVRRAVTSPPPDRPRRAAESPGASSSRSPHAGECLRRRRESGRPRRLPHCGRVHPSSPRARSREPVASGHGCLRRCPERLVRGDSRRSRCPAARNTDPIDRARARVRTGSWLPGHVACAPRLHRVCRGGPARGDSNQPVSRSDETPARRGTTETAAGRRRRDVEPQELVSSASRRLTLGKGARRRPTHPNATNATSHPPRPAGLAGSTLQPADRAWSPAGTHCRSLLH